MWAVGQRQAPDRAGLRYPSDLTDAEWALAEPFVPPARRGGRRRAVDLREVLNGIFHVLATGCQWRALPTDLPRSEEHTSELQSRQYLVCRLLLEKKT